MLGETSKKLLSNILKCPSDENYNSAVKFLSSDAGAQDFSLLVRQNNVLSVIFLKNYVQKWIDCGVLKFFYSENFLIFLIKACEKGEIKAGSLVHVADFMEILSCNYLVTFEILGMLINLKMFIFVDAVFKKYTTQPRSNRLFTEINTTIPMFFPVFAEMFFDQGVLQEIDSEYQKVLLNAKKAFETTGGNVDNGDSLSRELAIKPNMKFNLNKGDSTGYILSIFYSLTFQDIHPLFEDNADHFFKIFFILFDQNQLIVNQIFDLFLTKYPEITNFQLIVLTLARFDSLDGLAVNTLTKAYSSSRYFPTVILNFLQRNLNVEMSDDWLSNTQNFVKGNDMQRGFVHKLIRLLNCSPFSFTGEPMFFVASVLKYRDDNIIKNAFSNISSENSSDMGLVFSAFGYLIAIHEFGSKNVPGSNYNACCGSGVDLDKTTGGSVIDNPLACSFFFSYLSIDLRFICMKYLANCIKFRDDYHMRKISKKLNNSVISHSNSLESVQFVSPGASVSSPNILIFDIQRLFRKTIEIVRECYDEFSCDLLLRLVKTNSDLVTVELYDIMTEMFLNVHVMSSVSLTSLFDLYILLTVSLKKYNLALIETILNKEITEIYNLCFYYTSILIQETSFKESFVLYILSQNALWNAKDLHPGLCCILISAFRKGIVKKEQIVGIAGRLEGFNRVFVMNKTGLSKSGESSPEENYLVNGILDSDWFLENFLQKKYVRMIIKKMIAEKVPLGLIQQVVNKNYGSIEFENYLHSVSIYFDI